MKRYLALLLVGACGPNYQVTELPWKAHSVVLGGVHTLVLTEADGTIDAGTVEAYGDPIDLPQDPNTSEPVMLDLPTATELAVGLRHACVVSAGQVSCWGDNDAGALGAHRACNTAGCVLEPGTMPTLPAIKTLAAGWDFTCATTMDGTVMCWGTNSHGELGGSLVPSLDPPTPIKLPDDKPLYVQAVHVFESTACAIDRTNSAWCWGDGYGAPQRLPYSNVTDVAVGSDHGCVIAGGQLTCWGDNINGQIDATLARQCQQGAACSLPPTVVAMPAERVVVGERHTCVLASGDVTCFGSNEHGQLATSDSFLVGDPNVALSGAVDVVAGDTDTCALTAYHLAYCWGDQ
jgi:alpha-tubulin suppressor-like RCC1 family protein